MIELNDFERLRSAYLALATSKELLNKEKTIYLDLLEAVHYAHVAQVNILGFLSENENPPSNLVRPFMLLKSLANAINRATGDLEEYLYTSNIQYYLAAGPYEESIENFMKLLRELINEIGRENV